MIKYILSYTDEDMVPRWIEFDSIFEMLSYAKQLLLSSTRQITLGAVERNDG